jgi:hypothetical protein
VIFRIGILLPGIVSPVRQKNEELCLKKLKDSSAFRVIPGIVTGVSGIVTADSGEPVKIGHDETESAVTFDRNERSRSIGISGHVRPEYARPAAPGHQGVDRPLVTPRQGSELGGQHIWGQMKNYP